VVGADRRATRHEGSESVRILNAFSIYDTLMDGDNPIQGIIHTEILHLDLLPAERDLLGAEIELVSATDREKRLRRALEGVKENYDFILIDCPPSLAFSRSTPSSPRIRSHSGAVRVLALEGLSEVMATLQRICERSQTPPSRWRGSS